MEPHHQTEDAKISAAGDPSKPNQTEYQTREFKGITRLWDGLVRFGLGESILRIGTSVLSVAFILIVVWIMSSFYLGAQKDAPRQNAAAANLSTAEPALKLPTYDLTGALSLSAGIGRLADAHTSLPSRPRFDVTVYQVIKGDTIFGIAEKFGLNPKSILWGNRDALGDDPHWIIEGMDLNILPIDGVYHKWSSGESLVAVAEYYKVPVEDITGWPSNHLTGEMVADLSHPSIEPGTMLIIPGGQREFSSWTTPRITRTNPATAKNLGPGYCGTVVGGISGAETFVFPTVSHFLSGFDYTPDANHPGLDFDGDSGTPIFASDSGVVVYAGLNNYGYGNMVVIDHGNGWQTLYAHLSAWYVECGMGVIQGATIGAMGSTGNSTGPHLHFEMRSDTLGKVNPWNYLQ